MTIYWPGTSLNGKTCAVTNGSPTVTVPGNLSSDIGSYDPGPSGWGFIGPDDRTYGVASVISYNSSTNVTTFTLARNYAGTTVGSGGRFDLLPFNGLSAAAAIMLGNLLAQFAPNLMVRAVTVASLPSATPDWQLLAVTDASGGACLAVSYSGAWKKIALGATVT